MSDKGKKAENENPTLLQKYWLSFHRNAIVNIRFYFTLFLLVILYAVSVLSEMGERLASVEREIRDSKMRIVGLTTTGKVIEVGKHALGIDEFAPIIATIVEDYLVQSRHSLADHSNARTFNDWKDLYNAQSAVETDKNIRTFGRYFVDRSKDENGITHGLDSYTNYLTKLVIWFRRNEIPASVDTMGYKYDKNSDWRVINENEFWLKLKIDSVTSGVTIGGLKYISRKTFGFYEVRGYIDINKRDDSINPFGVMFTDIQVTPAMNASDAEVLKDKSAFRGAVR